LLLFVLLFSNVVWFLKGAVAFCRKSYCKYERFFVFPVAQAAPNTPKRPIFGYRICKIMKKYLMKKQ